MDTLIICLLLPLFLGLAFLVYESNINIYNCKTYRVGFHFHRCTAQCPVRVSALTLASTGTWSRQYSYTDTDTDQGSQSHTSHPTVGLEIINTTPFFNEWLPIFLLCFENKNLVFCMQYIKVFKVSEFLSLKYINKYMQSMPETMLVFLRQIVGESMWTFFFFFFFLTQTLTRTRSLLH